jgi:type IV secretion system protein VirD4
LLDEFPSLGRLDFFETSLAFLAGYGLKAMLITQSLNQLEKAYGPHSAILDNCHVRVTYAANDDKTARRISDLLGQATLGKLQKTFSGSGLFLSNRSESHQEYGRALLTPAEVTQLPEDEGLVLVGGQLPYHARKVRYFLDPRFRGRDALLPPESPDAQARELLLLPPCEWNGLRAGSSGEHEPATDPDAAAAVANTPTSPPASSEATADVWAGFFEGVKTAGDASRGARVSEADGDGGDDTELPL